MGREAVFDAKTATEFDANSGTNFDAKFGVRLALELTDCAGGICVKFRREFCVKIR